MWLKLYSRLLCLCPNFFLKTPKACKSKFSEIFKAYKDDKEANSISRDVRHTCKFYNATDTWCHEIGTMMKHISTSSSDNVDIGCDSQELKIKESKDSSKHASSAKKCQKKKFYQKKTLEFISRLVVNSKDIAKNMQVASGFMSNLDKHMKKLREVVDYIIFSITQIIKVCQKTVRFE